MMKTIYKNLLFIFLITLTFSCEVVDLEKPNVPTNENGDQITRVDPVFVQANDSTNFRALISDSTSKTWEASFFTIMGVSQSCRFDDVMIFFENGTYQYSSGPELCFAEDSQSSRNGSWEVDYANRRIIFDKGLFNEYKAEVIGLSEGELRLKGVYRGMEIRGLYSIN